MRLVIGAPGNGTVLKDAIKERLAVDRRVSSVVDLSAPGITYPEVSFRAGRAIAEGEADRGILICGTGVGTAIAAGKGGHGYELEEFPTADLRGFGPVSPYVLSAVD